MTYCPIPFMWNVPNGQTYTSILTVTQSWGEGIENDYYGVQISLRGDENMLELEVSDGCTTLWML